MTSESNDPSTGGRRRRSSFTDMFARPSVDTSTASSVTTNGPRTSSMANAMQQRARRMSITSIGLSGSPTGNPASAFDSLRNSQNMGQARAPNGEGPEDAVEDEDEVGPLNGDAERPTSPNIGRRLSFGARAYRAGSGASSNGETTSGMTSDASGTSPGTKGPSSPPGTRKEGFNWTENLRARAQRSSVSAGTGNAGGFLPLSGIHSRSRSVAEQGGVAAAPAPPPPVPPPAQKAPDHFQERILKGDFYMD